MSADATPVIRAYKRVSTERQVEEGYGFDDQERRLTGYAEREGRPLVLYAEGGVSGAKHSRPALDRLLAELQPGDTVLVTSLDRLGRSTQHLLQLFDRFDGDDVRLVSLRESIDSATPAGRLLRTLLAAVAEFERELIVERTTAGLAGRARSGKAVGALPLGYRADQGQRVIDPAAAALYERIVRDAERGLTPGAICRALNAVGHRTARGGVWSTRAVRSVLRNDDYLGGNGYPALIERDRWDALQARLTRMDPAAVAARKGGRPAGEDAVLAGVAFCGHCGERMYMRRAGTSRHYRCKHAMEGACNAPSVRADVAEAHVLMHLQTVVGEQLHAWLAERAVEHVAQRDALVAAAGRERARLRVLERTLQRATGQHRRLLDEDPSLADAALRQVATLDADVDAARQAVGDAEARAAEFAVAPDQRAAFDHLSHLSALLGGRLSEAKGGAAINGVLRSAVEGVWLRVEGGVLHADMRAHSGVWAQIEGDPEKAAMEGWATVGGPPEWLVQTERQTFV